MSDSPCSSKDYLCEVCGKEVLDSDMGVQCDGRCNQWFHCTCVCLTKEDYDRLSCNADAVWKCRGCSRDSFNTIDVFHFDFEKNLPTPKLTVGEQFYQRLLWSYLFGIYSASLQAMTALMRNELTAKRGPNDVISCLSHFIHNTSMGRSGVKHSIWWAEKVVNDEIVEFSHRDDVWVRHTYDIGEEPQQVSYEKKKGSCAA